MKHRALIIDSDLEMTASVFLEYWTDENGQFGQPVLEMIQNDPTLSQRQKDADLEICKTLVFSSSTRGSMVVPGTGELVRPDENGKFPEGLITQLEYWQSLAASDIPGETLAQKVYAALIKNMEEIISTQNI
jgi:hypothetical protein